MLSPGGGASSLFSVDKRSNNGNGRRMQRRWWSWARQRRQPPRHSNSPIAAAARQPRTSSLVDVTTSRTARMKSTSVRERRWVPAKKRVAWQQHAESSRRQLTESTAPRMQRRWWSWARQRRQPPRHSNSPIAAAARQPRTSSLVDVTTSRTARMKSTSVRERRWVPAKKRVAWQQHAESSRRQLTESTAPSPRPVTSSRLRQRRRSRAICGKRRSPSSVFQQ
nr:hypothetical protein Itr_chr14CG11790 [Ipomoea trifida]